MTPITFEGRFGWLHEAAGDCGVVLCGAHGYEQLCAHSGWRILAEQIAARGFPALRFDYAGAGDSLGGDSDPHRLTEWKRSVELAIDELKRRTGVRRIALAGLRLGATLAAEVAAQRSDVAGLALLAPVVSGHAYLREMSAVARMAARPAPESVQTRPGLEVQGFHLSEETQADLRKLEFASFAETSRPKILIVAPQGQANAEALATRLAMEGCEVARAPFDGYVEFIAEPTFSRLPAAAFAATTDWLAASFPPSVEAASLGVAREDCAPLQGAHFTDTPIRFGPDGRLFGFLCRAARPNPDLPLLVFANAGANPHIGWARMTVEGARALAARGLSSFRLDAAGLGDSPSIAGRPSRVMYSMEATQDVRAALDAMDEQGYSDFFVVGLCSGAHMAFHTAIADPRIGGLAMVNLQKFIWNEGDSLEVAVRNAYRSNDFYKEQAFRMGTWKRLMRGEIAVARIAGVIAGRLAAVARSRLGVLASAWGLGSDSDTARIRNWFRGLSRRGARILLVYSSEDGGLDELAQHMGVGGRLATRLPGTSMALIPGADRNLTHHWARERFFALLAAYITHADHSSN